MPKEIHYPQNTIFPITYIYYIYKRYKSKLEKISKNPYKKNFKIFSSLIRRFHEKVVNRMIYDQYVYIMPHRLGEVFVVKKKLNIVYDENDNIDYEKSKLKVDFPLTRKYNKKMYYYNNHTRGYYMRFHWRKRGGAARVKNIGVYSLKMQGRHKEELSVAINKLYVKGKIDFYKIKSKNDDTPRT